MSGLSVREGLAGLYRRGLSHQYRDIPFWQLAHYEDDKQIPLSRLFVPLGLSHERITLEQQYDADLKPPQSSRTFDPERYILQALEQSRHIVLLGDPGSGKSTLIRSLLLSFAQIPAAPIANRLGELLPIPIILRDYKGTSSEYKTLVDWRKPEDMLAAFLARQGASIRAEATVEWLLSFLEAGKAILLIDGLDEVGDLQARDRLRDEVIEPLIWRARAGYTVLTSRIVGYEDVTYSLSPDERDTWTADSALAATRLPIWYVTPFNGYEIRQFVQKWYDAREADEARRTEFIGSLNAAIENHKSIRLLAGNPSLLTLMALVHRVSANLPDGRAELYEKIAETYLQTLDASYGLPSRGETFKERRSWLGYVGYEMQRNNQQVATLSSIQTWLLTAMRKTRPDATPSDVTELIEWLSTRAALLVARSDDAFAFVHLSFQEFFAAHHLFGGALRLERLTRECIGLVQQVRWHETLLFLFEMLRGFDNGPDDLADLLREHANERDEAARINLARFFCVLLNDSECGLSATGRYAAIAFSLDALAESGDESLFATLADFAPARADLKIACAERLTWEPSKLQPCFFVVAPQFFYDDADSAALDWPNRLRAYYDRFKDAPGWERGGLADQILFWLGDDEDRSVASWAVDKLALSDWLEDNWWRSRPEDLDTNWIIPSDAYLLKVLNANSEILGETSSLKCLAGLLDILVITGYRSGIDSLTLSLTWFRARHLTSSRARSLARVQPLIRTYSATRSWSRSRILTMSLSKLLSQSEKLYQGLSRTRTIMDAMTRSKSQWPNVPGLEAQYRRLSSTLTRTQTQTQSLLEPLLNSLTEARRDAANYQKRLATVAEDLAFAEQCFAGQPESRVEPLRQRLRERLSDPDDWTRLCALTALMLLGDGTPERCAARNALVTKGIRTPDAFTLPPRFDDDPKRPELRLHLRAILADFFYVDPQKPNDHWLTPDLFDRTQKDNPEHPAYFFCATPTEFYERAEKVLTEAGNEDAS